MRVHRQITGTRTDCDGGVLRGSAEWSIAAGKETYGCVAAVAEDLEAGLGGERLAAGDDAIGAVHD